MLKHTALAAMVLLALAGCQKGSGPAPSTPPQASHSPSGQVITAISNPAISVTPDSLQNCDGAIATVHWDASRAGENTGSTEIWVDSPDADTKLFSVGGNNGEAKTGAWTRPGTHFLLKNKLDGKVLGETVVGGHACK